MPFNDLREFIGFLEKEGELVRVREEVEPKFEIGGFNRLLIDSRGPAVLFENVKGSPAPIVTHLFGSMKRINIALGTRDRGESLEKFLRALDGHWLEPRIVKEGPCKEKIINNPDLTKDIPNIIWGELDGGAYITMPLVVTKDPDTEKRNVGIYRFMIHAPKEGRMLIVPTQHIGMSFAKKEKQRKPLEVAIALGGDPILYLVGAAPLKYLEDEFALAGALRGEPLNLVKCETVDLEVPATSECVIEGEILPNVREPEGPFGEYTGYYGARGNRPVFKVKCITHRDQYIFPGTYETKPFPPSEDALLRSLSVDAGIFYQIRKIIPEIKAFHMLESSGVSYIGVVQIDNKPYPNFAKQVMDAVWATHKGCWIKILIVVDKDVDPFCIEDVMWAIATRVQPHQDMMVIPNHVGFPLDPSSERPGESSHLGIDATIKVPERFEKYPPLSIPSENLLASLKAKYGSTDFWKKLFE